MVHQPFDVLTIDHIYVCIALQNAHTIALTACADGNIEMAQMMPLSGLLLPDGVRHAQGSDDKHSVNRKRISQVGYGRERRGRFAQTHVEPQGATLGVNDELDNAPLILMEIISIAHGNHPQYCRTHGPRSQHQPSCALCNLEVQSASCPVL